MSKQLRPLRPKYVIRIHDDKSHIKYLYAYNLELDKIQTTTDKNKAKVFKTQDEVQGVIDEIMGITKAAENCWIFSYDEK